MTLRSTIKAWCPPAVLRVLGPVTKRRIRFSGDYSSWPQASAAGSGYDSAAILARVRDATNAVVTGRAAAERDGALLDHAVPPFELIATVLRVAQRNAGEVVVVDFGGALGTTYFQCRAFCDGIARLEWRVVEQPAFAACGRAEFQTPVLRFFDDFEQSMTVGRPNVIVFSGALQYVPDPLAVLAKAVAAAPDFILIDRTPTLAKTRNVLALQSVPKVLGGASYPVWLFNVQSLLEPMAAKYRKVCEFDTVDSDMDYRFMPIKFRGFLFERNAE